MGEESSKLVQPRVGPRGVLQALNLQSRCSQGGCSAPSCGLVSAQGPNSWLILFLRMESEFPPKALPWHSGWTAVGCHVTGDRGDSIDLSSGPGLPRSQLLPAPSSHMLLKAKSAPVRPVPAGGLASGPAAVQLAYSGPQARIYSAFSEHIEFIH